MRFGWSFELPAGWRYRPATEDWPAHVAPAAGAAYTDNFERPGQDFPAIDVSTQLLPADQTQKQFVAALDAATADVGCTAEATEEITVDGVVGRLQRQGCAGGFEAVWEVVAFDGERAYVIYWVGRADAAATDEPAFRRLLTTFEFPAGG